MSDAPQAKSGKTKYFLIGAALIVVLAFIPVWKCPPCEGTGKRTVIGLDCTVCNSKGRVAVIPTLFGVFWDSFKLRNPVH